MIRVVAIGECMIELTHRDQATLTVGVGGDTFNTAAYLARLGASRTIAVDYLTLLGDDHYSERILGAMRAEGIGTELVGRVQGGRPGLYLVHTDTTGERTFTHYRSDSAARRLFGTNHGDLARYHVLFLSAITLQILTPDARDRLRQVVRQARDRGAEIVFDSNYRPSGWPDQASARQAIQDMWSLATIGLPSFTDERLLFDDPDPAATVKRLSDHGVREVVVKNGSNGCFVSNAGTPAHIPAIPVEQVVDTTAAGDAFNAGYLAARLTGAPLFDAVHAGQSLARTVIGYPGAIVAANLTQR